MRPNLGLWEQQRCLSFRQCSTHQKGRGVLRLLFLLLPVLSAVVYCWGSTVWGKGALRRLDRVQHRDGSSRVTSAGWQAEAGSTLAEGAFAACIPLGEPGGSDGGPQDALLNVAG
ncbi:uncharacterized protein WM294_015111 isoform 1-T1 [Sarcoramphus papa]